jgi:hypothetical protein
MLARTTSSKYSASTPIFSMQAFVPVTLAFDIGIFTGGLRRVSEGI